MLMKFSTRVSNSRRGSHRSSSPRDCGNVIGVLTQFPDSSPYMLTSKTHMREFLPCIRIFKQLQNQGACLYRIWASSTKMSVCTSVLTQLLQDIPASAIQKASKASSLEKCFSLSWIVMVTTVHPSLLR